MAPRFPLVDPDEVRDACGVGFIAARDGPRPLVSMLRLAVECLVRLDHRGAKAAGRHRDGAGPLTPICRIS